MLSTEEQSRYARQIMLPEFGSLGQEKLKAARVLVIGAGGLGCPILQYLTAAGVGTIGIADGDTLSLSNLQRQVLYSAGETGLPKARLAAEKMKVLNPHVTFVVHPVFINADNVLDIIREFDIVVDGSDNFATRYLVNDACVILDKPMVSGAIYKYEGQVSVFNYAGGPTYRCIFPEPPAAGESPNCADIGVIATLPGIIGTIQANEVIKLITGLGEVLSGKLLVMNTLTMDTRLFTFKLNPANKEISELKDMPEYCTTAPATIDYDTLQQSGTEVTLIDVREPAEHTARNIGGINIPLSQLAAHMHTLQRDRTIVLYCATGVRSSKAALTLMENGFGKVMSLKNGMSGIPAI